MIFQKVTIDCLEQHISDVSDKCQREIYSIAEIQADDFHLDRALFLACRHDKEQFCGRVQVRQAFQKKSAYFGTSAKLGGGGVRENLITP